MSAKRSPAGSRIHSTRAAKSLTSAIGQGLQRRCATVDEQRMPEPDVEHERSETEPGGRFDHRDERRQRIDVGRVIGEIGDVVVGPSVCRANARHSAGGGQSGRADGERPRPCAHSDAFRKPGARPGLSEPWSQSNSAWRENRHSPPSRRPGRSPARARSVRSSTLTRKSDAASSSVRTESSTPCVAPAAPPGFPGISRGGRLDVSCAAMSDETKSCLRIPAFVAARSSWAACVVGMRTNSPARSMCQTLSVHICPYLCASCGQAFCTPMASAAAYPVPDFATASTPFAPPCWKMPSLSLRRSLALRDE